MEWLIFLIILLLASIPMIKIGSEDLIPIPIILLIALWFFVGISIKPEYISMDKNIELYKLHSRGNITEFYYETEITEIYTEALLNTGKTQKTYTISSIQMCDIIKPKLVLRKYSWDDNVFPYNIFPTQGKNSEYILYIPNN